MSGHVLLALAAAARDAGADATRSASVSIWNDSTQKRLLADLQESYRACTEYGTSCKECM